MQTLLSMLSERFLQATQTAFPNTPLNDIKIDITPSTQAKFGDYQFNNAMKLAGMLKQKPRGIAEAILAKLDKTHIHQCEIAGPGFINITLDRGYLSNRLQTMLDDVMLGVPPIGASHKLVIDFSSPNVAKEMHVGHLRSTIIGDCLARVFEFLHYQVLRLNHVGDWGTAFGMLIAHMKDHAQRALRGSEPTTLTSLVTWYRESKKRFDHDLEFKKRAQLEVVALQRKEPSSLQAWNIICSISRHAYQEIYDLLNIRIIERGESFYNPMLPVVVADLEQKGLVTISEGAKCIFLEGFSNREGEPLPLMVQKSDGGYNYDTTDMAAIRHRIETEHADRIIYVTDAGQSVHFDMIFKAAEKAGYLNPAKVLVNHVPFGLVLGADGKKFRTRSGDTERLIDLLQAAIERAKAILLERDAQMEPEQINATARILGINAIKYADLCCHRTSDYTFSYDRMLRFDGNTAAFLMYALVRINSIKRKIGKNMIELKACHQIALAHPSEIALGLHLNQFGEVLEKVAQDLYPHHLTEYLYTLAEHFNAFFRDCRVEGDPAQASRLLLCEVTARVLQQGLTLLGLQTVEKM